MVLGRYSYCVFSSALFSLLVVSDNQHLGATLTLNLQGTR